MLLVLLIIDDYFRSYNRLIQHSLFKANIALKTIFWCSVEGNVSGKLQVPRSPEDEHCLKCHLPNFQFLRWFLRSANCFQKWSRTAQISSTRSRDIKCHGSILSMLVCDPCAVFLSKKLRISISDTAVIHGYPSNWRYFWPANITTVALQLRGKQKIFSASMICICSVVHVDLNCNTISDLFERRTLWVSVIITVSKMFGNRQSVYSEDINFFGAQWFFPHRQTSLFWLFWWMCGTKQRTKEN